MAGKNRYLDALKENYNTVGIATAVALSAAFLNPLPLVAGLIAEAAYLLVVPDTKWYAERLARRSDADVERRRQEIKARTLPTLRPEMQARFARLEEMRRQIDTQAQDDKAWFREVLRKLDYLLDKFLMFAGKEAQFRDYLQSLRSEVVTERQRGAAGVNRPSGSRSGSLGRAPRRSETEDADGRRSPFNDRAPDFDDHAPKAKVSPDVSDRWATETVTEIQKHYAEERARVTQALEDGPDDDTRAVLEKRADVLTRREEFAGKIGKILTNLQHQLQLVEDTFGLINDEIRARSPEQILADIEEVVLGTETMASALEELAPLEQMIARVGE